jgi:8-oxo-dGTP pyrophosphatase MutT (NUDIX family)
MRPYVITIPEKDGMIWWAYKKRGHCAGFYSSSGGKVKDLESPIECARREIFEEYGVSAQSLEHRGYIVFSYRDDPLIVSALVFAATISGTPQETEEMRLEPFARLAPPYELMVEGDQLWIPKYLRGESIDERL